MASSKEFIDFIYDQVAPHCAVTYKKMFGEYMFYCGGKPVLLVCDDTVYVKQIPDATDVFARHGVAPDAGVPYTGARSHYILDIENVDLSVDMINTLVRVLPMPAPKKPRSKK